MSWDAGNPLWHELGAKGQVSYVSALTISHDAKVKLDGSTFTLELAFEYLSPNDFVEAQGRSLPKSFASTFRASSRIRYEHN